MNERNPARYGRLVATKRSLKKDGLAEQFDDEDDAREFKAESQVGIHRHTVAMVDDCDDPLPMSFPHQFSQVNGLELQPDPGEAVFRKNKAVIRVNGVGRDRDSVRVAFLYMERLIAEPFVPNNSTV